MCVCRSFIISSCVCVYVCVFCYHHLCDSQHVWHFDGRNKKNPRRISPACISRAQRWCRSGIIQSIMNNGVCYLYQRAAYFIHILETVKLHSAFAAFSSYTHSGVCVCALACKPAYSFSTDSHLACIFLKLQNFNDLIGMQWNRRWFCCHKNFSGVFFACWNRRCKCVRICIPGVLHACIAYISLELRGFSIGEKK